jgi:hypothetical protein
MMIAIEYSRQHVVDLLRSSGWSDLADEASRVLPDPVDIDRLVAWGAQHGLPTTIWSAGSAAVPESGGSPRALWAGPRR